MTEPSTGKGNEGGIRFRDFNAETGLYAGDAHCILQLADGRLARRVHALPAEKGHVIELSTRLRDCKGTEIFENNIIEAVATVPIPESQPRKQRDIMKRMEANEHRKLYAEAVSKLLAFRGKEQ